MRLTYIRWSMTIIETAGLTIVTDPVFRVFGLHQAPKTYTLDRMPRPDLVFLSHTHVDHLDRGCLTRLPAETPVWMPACEVEKVSSLGLKRLHGLEAWQSERFGPLRLTAVPAVHSAPELGLVIEGDRTLYFAGDTSLDRDLFREIGSRWALDAVLLPIGDLRVLGVPIGHLSPRRAPHALRLLGEPRLVVPTHYSGMAMSPFLTFWGSPRKLGRALDRAELGTVVGSLRPLESVEI